MAIVNTVTGPVDSSQLGRTLIHEHLYISFEGSEYDIVMPFDRDAFVRDAVNWLKAIKEHGVKTFVDPCPIDLGRDVSLMRDGTFGMPFIDIFTLFFPKLRARGVSDADISHIMDVNPGRIFSGVPF